MESQFGTEIKTDYSVITSHVNKLDGRVSPELKATLVSLESDGHKNMVLDLSATKYCDSSGLSAILIGNRLCKNAGGNFVICGLQEMVSKLVTLSQLDSVLTITPTLDEGIQYVLMEQLNNEIEEED